MAFGSPNNNRKGFFSKIFTRETSAENMNGAFKLQAIFIVLVVVCIIAVLA